MSLRYVIPLLVLVLGLTALFVWQRVDLRSQYLRNVWPVLSGVRLLRDQPVQMRDGVSLATDVYLPTRHEPPYPVIYVQTPYDKQDFFGGLHALRMFAPHGYAIAVQNVRGRFNSGGVFSIYDHAVTDGWDTLTWLAQQEWSNGRVGTFGCSALGEVQYILAESRHPAHAAMIAEAAGGAIGAAANRHGYFGLWEGGVFNLAAGVGWFTEHGAKTKYERSGTVTPELLQRLPIIDLVRQSGAPTTDYEDYVSHPPGDPWWSTKPFLDDARGFAVPGLHVNSWFDLGVADALTLAFARGAPDSAPQSAIVSPAAHCGSEEMRKEDVIGELLVTGADQPYEQHFLAFFDHWLKGGRDYRLPAVRVFVIGADRWVDLDAWPPEEVDYEDWFLGSEEDARTAAGDGRLSRTPVTPGSDAFTYDPLNPVPTNGGPHCCTGNPEDRPGSFDQSASGRRDDVLVYESDALDAPLTVIGPLTVHLEVATNAADTDFTAKLVDVWPDGRAFNVQDGVFRLRYRDGYASPKRAQIGEWYTIEIGLRAAAWQFRSGHRLRLEVSSSNFPRLARNLNTGGAAELEVDPVTAVNSVRYGGARGSRLVLPKYQE